MDTINGHDDNTKNKIINQRNACLLDSECNNKGDTHSNKYTDNNNQRNVCILGSICNTNGKDSATIGILGANCTNNDINNRKVCIGGPINLSIY